MSTDMLTTEQRLKYDSAILRWRRRQRWRAIAIQWLWRSVLAISLTAVLFPMGCVHLAIKAGFLVKKEQPK